MVLICDLYGNKRFITILANSLEFFPLWATKSNRLVPVRAIHPGEILREELRERGIKQKDFAQQIGFQATHLNEFIKGKRNLNENLAMKLEKNLDIPYKTWMNLHNGYVYDSKAFKM